MRERLAFSGREYFSTLALRSGFLSSGENGMGPDRYSARRMLTASGLVEKHGIQLFIKPDFSGWTGSPFNGASP